MRVRVVTERSCRIMYSRGQAEMAVEASDEEEEDNGEEDAACLRTSTGEGGRNDCGKDSATTLSQFLDPAACEPLKAAALCGKGTSFAHTLSSTKWSATSRITSMAACSQLETVGGKEGVGTENRTTADVNNSRKQIATFTVSDKSDLESPQST